MSQRAAAPPVTEGGEAARDPAMKPGGASVGLGAERKAP